MEKINIAELLKNCPQGMELDCLLCNNPIELEGVVGDDAGYPIKAVGKDGFYHVFTSYGASYNHDDAKCVIFPKGKTTWEGFVPPCQFKNGDVIYNQCIQAVAIFYKQADDSTISHCFQNKWKELKLYHHHCRLLSGWRLAPEEKKEELFQAIKKNGYEWNEKTKTLEELPKFKIGDRIKNKDNCRSSIVAEIRDNCFIIKTLDGLHHSYLTDKIPFSKQVEYELVTDKFNINTLKPFDKVLVRGNVGQKWTHDFFGFMDKDKGFPFVCVGHYVIQCIPYEGNEHLLGTKNDCDEYYKTWE